MLRDRALIPLSHQHHNGLALCVLTRRTLASDSSPASLAGATRRIVDRYELELVNHFELEEKELFAAAVEHLGPLPIVTELTAEHRAIAAMVEEMRDAPSPELLERFCALLTAHIRREEAELFEDLQRRLPRPVLDRLAVAFEERAVRICL